MAIVWVEFKSSASVSCRDEECRWPPSPPTSVSGVALASSASKTARNPREIEHGAIVATVEKKRERFESGRSLRHYLAVYNRALFSLMKSME